jgi:energy-coupling factor transporter ATP-binding protein EcfA2
VHLGTKVEVAYFDQFRSKLDEESTLIDVISPGSDFVEIGNQRKHVISYLGDFLFAPQRARSLVSSLSGGERNRLLLARLFARPANVLVLDEPTNDLDIETLELLEELLQEYPGTLFLVSHDRAFIDNVVTQTIASEGDGSWREYAGGYQDWADYQAGRRGTRYRRRARVNAAICARPTSRNRRGRKRPLPASCRGRKRANSPSCRSASRPSRRSRRRSASVWPIRRCTSRRGRRRNACRHASAKSMSSYSACSNAGRRSRAERPGKMAGEAVSRPCPGDSAATSRGPPAIGRPGGTKPVQEPRRRARCRARGP